MISHATEPLTTRHNGASAQTDTLVAPAPEMAEQLPSLEATQPRAGSEISDGGVKDLVKVFKLLSDETRLRILLYLARHREMHVRALCEKLRQSQPAVSHHLALLRVAGLIEPRREGKHNFYRLLPERFQQLLDRVFEAVPSEERHIRFEDYVLQYAPEEQLV